MDTQTTVDWKSYWSAKTRQVEIQVTKLKEAGVSPAKIRETIKRHCKEALTTEGG